MYRKCVSVMSNDSPMESLESQLSAGGHSLANSGLGSSLLMKDIENNKDREIAIQAQTDYELGNNDVVLQLLDTLGTNKAVHHNRVITQFAIDGNVDQLLAELITSEDMDLDQHVLIDYNRALVLAKYKHRYEEAIDLLEQRRNLFTNESMLGFVDDKLVIKLSHLLALLYLEVRKEPTKAQPLLQLISEKCDSQSVPNNLQQLKAKCYLQMGSVKMAKRELKTIAGQPLLRSHLELQRMNYRKAMKVFQTCQGSPDAPPPDSPLMTNNEALINFGLGKKNTAVFQMSKCLTKCSPSSPPDPQMLYNYAIFHLFTGNPKSAFDILVTLAPLYRKNPQLWLRLAESRLEMYRSAKRLATNYKSEFDLCRKKHEIVNAQIGDGVHRKLILNGQSGSTNSSHEVEALCFARSCLNNALTLMNGSANDRCFRPSNRPSEIDANRLKISILLCLAYVNLTLDDYSLAIRHANDALKLSPTGYHKVLAHLYAGEALVYMDQISEAIGHFNPELFQTSSSTPTDPSHSANSNSAPQPSFMGNSGKAVLLYNLALAYTMRSELDKASETLRQVGQVSSNYRFNITRTQHHWPGVHASGLPSAPTRQCGLR